ncbi:hypothetical protein FisN_20Hu060 [Fistulifera solaris]|jgi:hypothetical protein|uniref:Uncharacterized protein n=1 Tax=Fistulifera solaris TaxID=1519565 RepID=A0A1Z5KCH6_FISSO|nr:hypothetical protein FisN_20Hu060 [Fistulifera solaris]|eukprot:GAX23855.1 hypothetical protein FisN_20Hu060 [Fistulifera solaris]
MSFESKKQATDEEGGTLPSEIAPGKETARENSVDSTQFFEAADEYDDYDDFAATSGSKIDKRQQDRGGSGGSGTIYSSKHVRAKESLPRSSKK